MSSLFVQAPSRGGTLVHIDGQIFWASAARDLEAGHRVLATVGVRVVDDLEPMKFQFELTHVTVTDEGATFIGTKEGHTIVGAVLHRNKRVGHLLVN